MAFMMPVVKNDYNIYKSNRNRRVSSECSNDKTSASSNSSCGTRRLHGGSRSADGPSLSTSPGSDFTVGSPAHRSLGGMSKQTAFHHGSLQHHHLQHQHGAPSRNSSRNSQSSLQSPAKSSSSSSSPPPKLSSTSSLNMFHSKLVDKLRRSLTSKSKDSEYCLLGNKIYLESGKKATQRNVFLPTEDTRVIKIISSNLERVPRRA